MGLGFPDLSVFKYSLRGAVGALGQVLSLSVIVVI